MPLIPFLKLQARLEGLPVEQLDMHMARQLAEELGQSYQAVSRLQLRYRLYNMGLLRMTFVWRQQAEDAWVW
jgi:hypothetical protein